MIGQTISHYRIVALLGEGGMGAVYRAEDTQLKREIALKVLPPEMSGDLHRLERFQREAEAVAALDHPNIVTIHSVETAPSPEGGGSVHFLTMSLVEGRQLDQIIPAGGMQLGKIFDLAIQATDALAAAHDKGIVHRDLKPANIMVSDEGRVKILDFGLAKLQEDRLQEAADAPTEALTKDGLVVGTVPYMSPEQVQGETTDTRTDLFSFGAVLYEMATGTKPFSGDNTASVVSSILRDIPRAADRVNAALPHHLGRIIKRCLEKNPKDRFQTARDVHNELRNLKEEVRSGEVQPSSATIAAVKPQNRSKHWAIAAGLAALAFVVWIWTLQEGAPEEAVAPLAQDAKAAVAVLHFENLTGDEDVDWLRAGLADMLVTDLSQSSDIQVLSTDRLNQVLRDLGKLEERTVTSGLIEEIAERTGVNTVLLGTYARVGETMRISIKVQRAETGEILSTDRVEGPAGDNVFSLVDDLSRGVRSSFETQQAASSEVDRELREVSTASLEAYRYYTEGLDLHMRGETGEATTLFQQAIALDPGFAMAHARLSAVLYNQGRRVESIQHSTRALENAGSVPPRERLYIEGTHYGRSEGTLDRALQAWKQLEEVDPYGGAAPHNRGLILLLLERFDEAIESFDEAIHRGTRFAASHHFAAYARGTLGRHNEGVALLQQYLADYPQSFVAESGLGSVYASWGKLDHAAETLRSAYSRRPSSDFVLSALFYTRVLREEWEAARDASVQRAGLNQATSRLAAARFQATLLLYRGQSEAARALLGEAIAGYPSGDANRAFQRIRFGHLLLDLEEDDAALAQAELAAADAGDTNQRAPALYLAALIGLRNGERQAAEAAVHSLAEIADRLSTDRFRRKAYLLQGWLASSDQDRERAIAEFERAAATLTPSWWGFSFGAHPDHAEVWMTLAETHLEGGDDAGARKALASLAEAGFVRTLDPVPYVRSLYLLATVLERQGEIDEARRYYRRFLDYWRDGDLNRNWVEEARAKVGG